MKTLKISSSLLLTAVVYVTAAARLRAEDQPFQQRTFASPAEATNALLQAAKAHDHQAIHQIFGPEVTNLMTGDKTLDERHFDAFANDLTEQCSAVKNDNGNITLEIGTNRWPFPIPLIQTNGSWSFDTLAGEDEIINRHIGRDEFYAIGVCRAYVKAQRDYGARFTTSGGTAEYARRFKSEAGKTDGLYWESETNSPFSSFVAEAAWEGYGWTSSKRPKPFHGYFFKILTRQGPDAPGGAMDYIHGGKMTSGFALVAYPVRWGESGIMTFIVGSDGIVRQQNLGEKTLKIATRMKTFNPDKEWSVVDDPGITDLSAEDSAGMQR
jgi:hypothetical protein